MCSVHKRHQTAFTTQCHSKPLQLAPCGSGDVWSSAQFGTVQSSRVWLRTEQVVCDSRHELTSKHPQRGNEGDVGRQNGGRRVETERWEKSEREEWETVEWEGRRGFIFSFFFWVYARERMEAKTWRWLGECEQGGRDKGSAACLQTNSLRATLVNTNCSTLIKVSHVSPKAPPPNSPSHTTPTQKTQTNTICLFISLLPGWPPSLFWSQCCSCSQ